VCARVVPQVNELVLGSIRGELAIFKGVAESSRGSSTTPWLRCGGLGAIAACAVGELMWAGHHSLAVVTAEGWLHLFHLTAPLPPPLEQRGHGVMRAAAAAPGDWRERLPARGSGRLPSSGTPRAQRPPRLWPVHTTRVPLNCCTMLLRRRQRRRRPVTGMAGSCCELLLGSTDGTVYQLLLRNDVAAPPRRKLSLTFAAEWRVGSALRCLFTLRQPPALPTPSTGPPAVDADNDDDKNDDDDADDGDDGNDDDDDDDDDDDVGTAPTPSRLCCCVQDLTGGYFELGTPGGAGGSAGGSSTAASAAPTQQRGGAPPPGSGVPAPPPPPAQGHVRQVALAGGQRCSWVAVSTDYHCDQPPHGSGRRQTRCVTAFASRQGLVVAMAGADPQAVSATRDRELGDDDVLLEHKPTAGQHDRGSMSVSEAARQARLAQLGGHNLRDHAGAEGDRAAAAAAAAAVAAARQSRRAHWQAIHISNKVQPPGSQASHLTKSEPELGPELEPDVNLEPEPEPEPEPQSAGAETDASALPPHMPEPEPELEPELEPEPEPVVIGGQTMLKSRQFGAQFCAASLLDMRSSQPASTRAHTSSGIWAAHPPPRLPTVIAAAHDGTTVFMDADPSECSQPVVYHVGQPVVACIGAQLGLHSAPHCKAAAPCVAWVTVGGAVVLLHSIRPQQLHICRATAWLQARPLAPARPPHRSGDPGREACACELLDRASSQPSSNHQTVCTMCGLSDTHACCDDGAVMALRTLWARKAASSATSGHADSLLLPPTVVRQLLEIAASPAL
jgi:hypothetical protein